MSPEHAVLLLGAGLVAGVINSVASGGSFFTYPAMILSGLNPLQAATTTLAALTPGNLAAVPEYWPEVTAQKEKYPRLLAVVSVGSILGIALLLTTGADNFDTIVPWLILSSVGLFAISPAVRRWAETSAPSITDGLAGWAILFVLSIYMTYFGSGVGNMFLAMLFIRGFGDFLSANAAKNIIMTLGTVFAAVAYTLAGHIDWVRAIPVLIGSAIGARYGARVARSIPVQWIRLFIIVFGVFVAVWQFLD